eukprot:553811_1
MSQTLPIYAVMFCSLFMIINTSITILSFYKFYCNFNSSPKNDNRTYFIVSAIITTMCNMLCNMSVLMYCIWIVFQPDHQTGWFVMCRALPTIFWFTSKVSLIWLYNGRLFYTFKDKAAIFQSSYTLFVSINTIFTIIVPLLIICGYIGIWYGNIWMSFGFEACRIIYFLLTFYLLIMFSKKMLLFHQYPYESVNNDLKDPERVTRDRSESLKISNHTDNGNKVFSDPAEKEEILLFVNMSARNAVLVLFISISACLVQLSWSVFDFILPQNYVTLLLPLNMFVIDSLLDSICIYLLFNFGANAYAKLCGSCHRCCNNICFSFAECWNNRAMKLYEN